MGLNPRAERCEWKSQIVAQNAVPFTDPGSSIVRGLKAEGHDAGANRSRLEIPHPRARPRELRQQVPEGWRGARPSRRSCHRTGRRALYLGRQQGIHLSGHVWIPL